MRIHIVAAVLAGGLLTGSVVTPARAQAPEKTRAGIDSAATAELLKARERIWRAWFASDSAELARLLPPATVAVEGQDGWQDRAAIIASSKQFAGSGGKLVRIQFYDTEITSYGSLAIVHARYELELENSGQRNTMRGRATEIFVRRDGSWVNPFWHLGT